MAIAFQMVSEMLKLYPSGGWHAGVPRFDEFTYSTADAVFYGGDKLIKAIDDLKGPDGAIPAEKVQHLWWIIDRAPMTRYYKGDYRGCRNDWYEFKSVMKEFLTRAIALKSAVVFNY